jgi:CRP/FNR family transcriptional regulator, anaerobic regulatory protein
MFSPDLLPATRSAPPAYPLVSEPADLSQIFVRQPIEKLQPGEAVFCEADPATDLVQVTEGCLRRYRILPDGRRAITGFAFGLISLKDRRTIRLCNVTALQQQAGEADENSV